MVVPLDNGGVGAVDLGQTHGVATRSFEFTMTNGEARLPNFLIIGAMKAGTTSLREYLRRHPQVFMSERKELDFFVGESRWRRGIDWYRDQFRIAGTDAIAVGEASPEYTRYPWYKGVPERIAAVIPDVRLIYLIRHPIDRMRSHYLRRVAAGIEHRPIDEALLTEPGYLNISRYSMQIRQYLSHFPRESMLIVPSERLLRYREDTLREVFHFLDVDATWLPGNIKWEMNQTSFTWLQRFPGYRMASMALPQSVKLGIRRLLPRRLDPVRAPISEALRNRLEEALYEDVLMLREYLGPTFDCWGLA